MPQEATIARQTDCAGIGLHSGKMEHLTLKPANAGTGIVFSRLDLAGSPKIHVNPINVTATRRATTLTEDGVSVHTVEHLLSALHAFGIDNCLIEMDGEEPPATDGSAKVYLDILEAAGREAQSKTRHEIIVDRVFRIDDGERFIIALPYNGFRVSFTSINEHKAIGVEYCDFILKGSMYEQEIAPARTVAYEKEVEELKASGLGRGGSLENVIVYNDNGWLNPLRFENELARHKIVDVMGDMRLAGFIKAHIIAVKSGHALNTRLAREIYEAYSQNVAH